MNDKVGEFTLRPLDMTGDMPLVHGWVTREHAKYCGLLGATIDEVEEAYREILQPSGTRVFIGLLASEPVFLLECYSPAEDLIGRYYDVQPGDRGMHILVAPTDRPVRNFTWRVFTAVMDFLFSDESVERIVVGPDVRNEKIHRLNRRAGFAYEEIIQLPRKTAYLAFCTRQQYRAALARDEHAARGPSASSRESGVAHLTPGIWATANALHVRKVIREFSHELLLRPRLEHVEDGWSHYVLATDVPDVEYRFRAQVLGLEHWHIDTASIQKTIQGVRVPLDSMRFIAEIRETIGMSSAALPTYMEELAATLSRSAYRHANQRLPARELAHADFQDVESGMTEAHPCFVADSGRIGFGITDHERYAPESGSDVRLVWLAGHRSRASFSSAGGLTHDELMRQELGEPVIDGFRDLLRREGLDPGSYLFMPVHPWQWENKLAHVLAPEIAARQLVFLGHSEDTYRAQQNIRTFFNLSRPDRHYIKTALSILDMGSVRGLSLPSMETTPAINEWVHALIQGDSYLRESGFAILRELATTAYRPSHYEAAIQGSSPYEAMLAALWRESPVPKLGAGQRLATMASLLHRDRDGVALLPELIRSSGIGAEAWLQRTLRAYLSPLLHCFYAHDLVFMPHGENLVLVLEGDVPVRVFMKEIGEDVGLLDQQVVLPETVQRIAVSVPAELKTLSIFTDVFDCVLRFVADILWEQCLCAEVRFWELVADCVRDYQLEHPHLAEKFRRFDLFAPEFRRPCLNRLQIANNPEIGGLGSPDPAADLPLAGTLANPIAPFRSPAPVARRLRERSSKRVRMSSTTSPGT